jgi:hypothetical protein
LLLQLAIGLLVVELLSSVPEPRPAMPAIDLVNGTVDITVAPVSGAITLTDMVPGDSVTGSVVVGNGGSGPFRYGLTSAASDPVLGAQLDLAVWNEADESDVDAGCSPVPPVVLLYGPSDLGGAAPSSVLAGRALDAGTAETLCFDIALPLTTGNEFQGASTVATFEFVSEDSSIPGAGPGAGATTTLPTETTSPETSTTLATTTSSTPEAAPPGPDEPAASPPEDDDAPAGEPRAPRDTGDGITGDAAGDGTGEEELQSEPVVDGTTTSSVPAADDEETGIAPSAGDGGDPTGGGTAEATAPEADGVWDSIAARLAPVIRAVREVASAARFPIVLLIAMVLFLLLQDSIDRRDPKLALAPVFPEPDVEFPTAPPGDLKATPPEPRNTG